MIVHSFRVVYQHLMAQMEENYDKNSVRTDHVLAEIRK